MNVFKDIGFTYYHAKSETGLTEMTMLIIFNAGEDIEQVVNIGNFFKLKEKKEFNWSIKRIVGEEIGLMEMTLSGTNIKFEHLNLDIYKYRDCSVLKEVLNEKYNQWLANKNTDFTIDNETEIKNQNLRLPVELLDENGDVFRTITEFSTQLEIGQNTDFTIEDANSIIKKDQDPQV